MQMRIDEMIDALELCQPDRAERFRVMLEAIGTEMAASIAQHYDCLHGDATHEGKGFAGLCAPFRPKYQGQPFPEPELWGYLDDGGQAEWEDQAQDADLPPLPDFTCTACGRPEADCSANPCPAVIADREA
ncbi:hypothetical protein [Sphingobium amiense]|nr:hypothetical protein [Sphingobium amiense]